MGQATVNRPNFIPIANRPDAEELDRAVWTELRRALIMQIAAIDRRLGMDPRKCKACGEDFR